MLDLIGNHIWQSTLFAGTAALITLFFRRDHARVRYWIWMAASVKFLVPFSLFFAIGNLFDFTWLESTSVPQTTFSYVDNISQPFGVANALRVIPANIQATGVRWIPIFIFAAWSCGFLAVLLLYLKRARRLRLALGVAKSVTSGYIYDKLRAVERNCGMQEQIKLAPCAFSMEPGIYGIFQPVLLFPEGMIERLNDSELDAILAHEVVHVRRHDNLLASIHMFIEALFWFHPVIWWLGAKVIQERERACDEEVLKLGKNPQSYAEGILKICEFYLESPLACVAGVTGADMKRRIQEIMTHRIGRKLSLFKKLILAMACFTALAIPFLIGLVNARGSQAKSQAKGTQSFAVATIKAVKGERCPGVPAGIPLKALPPMIQPGNQFSACSSLELFIDAAYRIGDVALIKGGPEWRSTVLFQIDAKTKDAVDFDEMRLMIQALLAERFKLKMRRETQETDGYSLVVAKGGPKLKEAKDENGKAIGKQADEAAMNRKLEDARRKGLPTDSLPKYLRFDDNEFRAKTVTVEYFASLLKHFVHRTVIDRTGITGFYDIDMRAGTAAIPNLSGKFIFEAVQQQLGLKLEPGKVPIAVMIIEKAEKPLQS